MTTETALTEVMSDLEAVCAALAARRPVDPTVAKRIRQRAEPVKEDIRRKGVTDIAVSLVREIRDEESNTSSMHWLPSNGRSGKR